VGYKKVQKTVVKANFFLFATRIIVITTSSQYPHIEDACSAFIPFAINPPIIALHSSTKNALNYLRSAREIAAHLAVSESLVHKTIFEYNN